MGGTRDGLDAEQPDAGWLSAESDRRREAFERDRTQRRVADAARREAEPLSRRFAACETRLLMGASAAASGGGEPSRGGKPGSQVPPYADVAEVEGADPLEVRRLFRLAAEAVRRLEQLCEGSASRPSLVKEELDAVLRTLVGLTPEEASAVEPSLGSPAAVVAARRRLKLRANDGTRDPSRDGK